MFDIRALYWIAPYDGPHPSTLPLLALLAQHPDRSHTCSRHHRSSSETCIYVSNHQSTMDFCFFARLPAQQLTGMCAIAKASIMFVPGFGAMTHLCGGEHLRGCARTYTRLVILRTE